MRCSQLLLLTAAGLSALPAHGGDSPIPTPASAERYAGMSKHSPFALATPVTPTAPPQASFAANWFVTGVARIGDREFVSIQARDLSMQFSLIGHEPHPATQVSLVEVQWSPVIGKSTVTLRKGTEVAQLEFNEATVHGGATAAATAASAANAAAAGKKTAGANTPPGSVSVSAPASGTPPVAPGTAAAIANIRRRIQPLSSSP